MIPRSEATGSSLGLLVKRYATKHRPSEMRSIQTSLWIWRRSKTPYRNPEGLCIQLAHIEVTSRGADSRGQRIEFPKAAGEPVKAVPLSLIATRPLEKAVAEGREGHSETLSPLSPLGPGRL